MLNINAYKVAQRYVTSDDRFRPPRHVLDGVDKGELDAKVLLVWKYVVEKLGTKFNYGAGVAYWRNKCIKEGYDVPPAYQKAGGGTTFGAFKIKTGDEIEEWVKERLRSAGLIEEAVKTAEECKLEINHLQSAVDKAKERVATHEKGIEKGTRVKQREKWLVEAKEDLEKASKQLDKDKEALTELQSTLEKHDKVEAPVIDFEVQFQTILHRATIDLSKKEVLIKARAALAKFEAEMMNPKFASEKQALDLWDMAKRFWDKLLNAVKGAFSMVTEWANDLISDTKQLDKILESVS